MGKKKRRATPTQPRARAAANASASDPAVQRGAQAIFFIAIAFVAAHEGIVGLSDPARTNALWALAAAGSLVGLIRRRDARFTDDVCLSLSSRARGGVLVGVLACFALAIGGAGNREHGLLATSQADGVLVGCLVFAGAMLSWGGAASAVQTMLGQAVPGFFAGALIFTMAFFSGNLYADAAVLVAAVAATITSQRTRSTGFASIVFAYGAGGVPAAIAASALYVFVAAARNL